MSNQLDVEIHGMKNFSPAERAKFKKAMNELVKVINSREFYVRWMALELVQTNGLTNKELYDLLMSGNSKFQNNNDRDIDVQITMYYSYKRVVGYTYPSTWATWINRKFFRNFTEAEIAANVFHEDWHNKGLGHKRASDHMSVPYAGGHLVRDMIRNGYDPTPFAAGDIPPTVVQVNRDNPDKPVKKTYFIPWYKRFWNWIKG